MLELLIMPYFDIRSRGEEGRGVGRGEGGRRGGGGGGGWGGGGGGGGGVRDMRGGGT